MSNYWSNGASSFSFWSVERERHPRTRSVRNSLQSGVSRWPRCASCGKEAKGRRGRSRKITSQEDVIFFSGLCGKAFAVNGELCDKCRRKPRRSDDEQGASASGSSGLVGLDENLVDTNDDEMVSEVEDEILSNVDDESEGETFDPWSELVDYPAPRTASTHCSCVFCKSRDNLSTITSSIRRSVINKAEIYIPEACRVCANHVIDSTSLRNTVARTRAQALFVFLTKLRSGNSDAYIASFLRLPHEAIISAIVSSVRKALEKLAANDLVRNLSLARPSSTTPPLWRERSLT